MSVQIDANRIIYECIDHETLIIDSETGSYYVLRESASAIWQMLSQGTDIPTLLHHLAQHYALPMAELQPPVQHFLDELQAAGLVTLQTSQITDALPSVGEAPASLGPTGATFVAPELHSFSDMHDLLLMDPIHEVAETGWPFAPVKR